VLAQISSYYYIPLHMCSHTAKYNTCVFLLLYMCPPPAYIYVLILLHMCPHHPYMCVLILLYLCLHRYIYVSSYYVPAPFLWAHAEMRASFFFLASFLTRTCMRHFFFFFLAPFLGAHAEMNADNCLILTYNGGFGSFYRY
jgi:hypothetical protein